ncbi:MAG TPA: hypothetical protein DCZ59_00195, partial [Bacteroidetes bacterium]|nr:hypothetical protein [Bacteroidota bacterium]
MLRYLLLLVVSTVIASAQVSTTAVDGLRDKRIPTVVYFNCTVVPSPGSRIDSAVIIVRGERIADVGRNLAIPPGAVLRDLRGAWVYAGFVEPFLPISSFSKSATGGGQNWGDDGDPVTPRQQGARYWNQAVRPERRASADLTIPADAVREWQNVGFGAA